MFFKGGLKYTDWASPSAAKLAALSWDPENLKKLSLNAYLQVFATNVSYLQIFATKMPYLQVFATKIALLNYMTDRTPKWSGRAPKWFWFFYGC